MTEATQWTVTYKHYRENTELLTSEIDRLTAQTDSASAVLDIATRTSQEIAATAKKVLLHTEKAESAWKNIDQIVARVGNQAVESATSGTQIALKGLIRDLNGASYAAQQSALDVKMASRKVGLSIAGFLVGGCLLVVTTVFATLLAIKLNPGETVDETIRTQAAIYVMLRNTANAAEQKTLNGILQRAINKPLPR